MMIRSRKFVEKRDKSENEGVQIENDLLGVGHSGECVFIIHYNVIIHLRAPCSQLNFNLEVIGVGEA